MGVHRKEILTCLFFLHRINVRKRVKKIPHLCEHRIDKKFFTENFTDFFTEFFTELSFFVKISQNYRFL